MAKKEKLKLKKTGTWNLSLVVLCLFFFPFGPLLGFILSEHFSLPFNLHPTDIILGILAIINIPKIFSHKPKWLSAIYIFVFTATISWLVSYFYYRFSFTGMLYLLRIWLYTIFFHVAFDLLHENNKAKQLTLIILFVEALIIAIFGWFQYIFVPDLRYLQIWDWDDHLYRLTSTFLDPAFTGILLVLGFFVGLELYFQKKNKLVLFPLLFLLAAILFTYSRASFLALFIGVLVFFVQLKKIKLIGLLLIVLLVALPVLPRPGGYGVRLERIHSLVLKAENYQYSLSVIRKNPLLGVGYNNLCDYKVKIDAYNNPSSHACSGLDNSFLFVLATTGVLGLFAFLRVLFLLFRTTEKKSVGILFTSSLVAVILHSQFTNTFFYPWVLGWLVLLTAISREEIKESI